jgi:hypothetical protein
MKKTYTLFLMLFFGLYLHAQVPQKMSYQSVIRNNLNNLVSNANVGIKVSILQGSASGTSVYTETHATSTNVNGLITIEIGGGNIIAGTFGSINWGSGLYFLKTETDPAGGTNYTLTTTSQLLSVPYSLHSKSSSDGSNAKTLIYSGY